MRQYVTNLCTGCHVAGAAPAHLSERRCIVAGDLSVMSAVTLRLHACDLTEKSPASKRSMTSTAACDKATLGTCRRAECSACQYFLCRSRTEVKTLSCATQLLLLPGWQIQLASTNISNLHVLVYTHTYKMYTLQCKTNALLRVTRPLATSWQPD